MPWVVGATTVSRSSQAQGTHHLDWGFVWGMQGHEPRALPPCSLWPLAALCCSWKAADTDVSPLLLPVLQQWCGGGLHSQMPMLLLPFFTLCRVVVWGLHPTPSLLLHSWGWGGRELHMWAPSLTFSLSGFRHKLQYTYFQRYWHVDLSVMFVCWAEEPLLDYRCLANCKFKRSSLQWCLHL